MPESSIRRSSFSDWIFPGGPSIELAAGRRFQRLRFTADWYARTCAEMTLKPRFRQIAEYETLVGSGFDAEIAVDAVKTAEGRYL